MKKLILSVAIITIVASCSTNEVADVAPSMQSAIGFSTLNDRVTKGANDSSQNYKVYAISSNEDAAGFYIDDYVVTTEGVDAVQTGPYYWPTDGSTLAACAYAPYQSECIVDATTLSDSGLALTYTVEDDAQEDFTCATKSTVTSETANGYIAFSFVHMLSKITVKVVLEDDFDINYDLDEESLTFDMEVNVNSATYKLPVAGMWETTLAEVEDGVTYKYTGAAYDGYYNIIPQSMKDCKISLDNITVTHTASGVKVFDGVSLTPITISDNEYSILTRGNKYLYTITVGADATPDDGEDKLTVISFSSEATGWGDGTASLKQE